MNSLTDSGLVLRRHRHLENDIRMTVFLRQSGKLSVVSKSSAKLTSKLKALHEPFTEADFQIYLPPHGTNGRLTGGKLIDSHEPIRRRYDAFLIASVSCEVVDMLLPFRAPSPEVFDILRAALVSLHGPSNPREEWIHFVAKLLKCLGHGDIEPGLVGVPLEQRIAVVDSELERVLPWRLKSDLSSLTPTFA